MAKAATGARGSVLRWARESQGYSVDEVAALLGREPDEITAWEDEGNDAAPTYAQLERLAYKLYNRPLAVFFLPEPPVEANLKQEFRTLPDFEIDQLSADTRYQLRLAKAFQVALGELNDGSNPAAVKIFRDIELTPISNVQDAAGRIRDYLGVPLETQRSWTSRDEALKTWRNAVEQVGVFVFKNSFKQRGISGFCLDDDEFPLIYLNNSTAKSRQIFSLFHELSHVLLHMNSISKVDESYVEALPQEERRIEQFCNVLTAEFLIPTEDFSAQIEMIREVDDESIVRLAGRYQVSREAVLRRVLDLGRVDQQYYERKAKQWAQEAVDAAASGKGGNYFTTRAAYLGENYMRLVFASHYQGKISTEQVADYLGVKSKNVARLEALAVGRASPWSLF